MGLSSALQTPLIFSSLGQHLAPRAEARSVGMFAMQRASLRAGECEPPFLYLRYSFPGSHNLLNDGSNLHTLRVTLCAVKFYEF